MIGIENQSPFPHFLFEKTGLRGDPFDVLVVGGSFEIVHASTLAPCTEQLPLTYADEYYGDPLSSSLRAEGNLVIGKKSTDVHVIGHARAPKGIPAREWRVGISIGGLTKTVRVTGRRWWEYTQSEGWRISVPEPCTEVPLRYELAYGGTVAQQNEGAQEQTLPYASNPIGVGYLGKSAPDPDRRYPAPQLEAWDAPIRDIGSEYTPEGFGPICRWWQPRIQRAGTYDENWRKEVFPNYPNDFDFSFYNAAHPDLICDSFLNGDESVSLTGFFPEGPVDTFLPGFSVVAVLTDDSGYAQPEELSLDTVTFDTDSRTARLVWRKTVPRSWGLASVVLGAIPPGPSLKDTTPRLAQLHR